MNESTVERRAKVHAALGDPARLAIVDELAFSDRAPIELGQTLDVPGNLLAHHLDVLEDVGLIGRTKSSGDGRRRYVHLLPGVLDGLAPTTRLQPGPALFVCTANSARSQLAAALWHDMTRQPAESAGTHPAAQVAPGAMAAAARAGLDLSDAAPHMLDESRTGAALVVTVCDRAHEELPGRPGWLHWSIPDPVTENTKAAFDRAVAELRNRISAFVPAAA